MPKKAKQWTRLYEVRANLKGFSRPLITHIDEEEWVRCVNVLEGDRECPRFYGFDQDEGMETYLHLGLLERMNFLDCVGGIQFEKRPVKSETDQDKAFIEREASDSTVVLRIWMANSGTSEVYPEVDYSEWTSIRFALEENTQSFIGFTDMDGERVIFNLASIAAIEAFDEHYLSFEQIERFMANGEDVAEKPESDSIGLSEAKSETLKSEEVRAQKTPH